MKFLVSNFPPSVTQHAKFVDSWTTLFNSNSKLNIAVGYASNDSLLYLRKLLELNSPKSLNITLGMPHFDGIYKSQYEAAMELHNYLNSSNLGNVFLSTQYPFHGKIQTFGKAATLSAGLVGSSNLSNIVPPTNTLARGNYEVDVLLDDAAQIRELDALINSIINEASTPIDQVRNLRVRQDSNALLHSSFEAVPVDERTQTSIWEAKLNEGFEIPIKTAAQSNLNAYFGEGRRNAQGFVKPRHWYEVEIIVGQEVQRSCLNYPVKKEFIAYTDDGYRFVLKTSGDYGKNLRSRDDLTVLGRWLKGRMEQAGALVSGNPVTEAVLRNYGRDSMTLTQTKLQETDDATGETLEVWTLDFGVHAQ